MELIKTHIFSFDRPAQLYLLLESIQKHDTYKRLSLFVQYTFSNAEFKKGYERVKGEFSEVIFKNENRINKKYNNPFIGNVLFNVALWVKNWRFRFKYSDFREVFFSNLNEADYKFLMFLTDDSIFYREIIIQDEILTKLTSNRYLTYSLATGKNITGGSYLETDSYLFWNLNTPSRNSFWSYPFSVDGRIYVKNNLKQISQKVIFSNPNSFETVMVLYHKYFNIFSTIYSNKQSSLIGFELNRVQAVYLNNNMNIDHNLINKYFNQNYKLEIVYEKTMIVTFRPKIIEVNMVHNNTGKKISIYK